MQIDLMYQWNVVWRIILYVCVCGICRNWAWRTKTDTALICFFALITMFWFFFSSYKIGRTTRFLAGNYFGGRGNRLWTIVDRFTGGCGRCSCAWFGLWLSFGRGCFLWAAIEYINGVWKLAIRQYCSNLCTYERCECTLNLPNLNEKDTVDSA